MSGSVLKPLLLLNATYLLMLITLGPRYGWTVMILIGAIISAFNILVLRTGAGARRNVSPAATERRLRPKRSLLSSEGRTSEREGGTGKPKS